MKTPSVTSRIIDHLLESDTSKRELADAARRLEPFTNDLGSAWARRGRAVSSALTLGVSGSADSDPAGWVALARQLLGQLRGQDLNEFYQWLADQGEQLALSGTPYGELVEELEIAQRASVPVLARAFPPGPELELGIAALENLYEGSLTILAGAYIEVLQDQLRRGARLQSVGRLAGGVAHSMNNLFAALLGRTQLLLLTVRDERSRGELSEIQNATIAGSRMMERLQQFARGGLESEAVETDVNEAVREAAELTRYRWRDEAEGSGILIDLVRDLGDVPSAMASPAHIREVLVDLIFNAIEAMPEGGIITLRTERRGEEVLVSVQDTGTGIEPTLQGRVFEPFFTTKGTQHAGLGLGRVRNALERCAGRLELESGAGQGTRVTLHLSVAEGLGSPSQTEAERGNGGRILIIDDEPLIRGTAAQLLEHHGHVVIVTGSGTEGRRALEEQGPFDVVLTDLGMPGMSGWEIAEMVKEMNPRTLVVLMTGWAVELDPRKVRASGVARILKKPFDGGRVVEVVNEALQIKARM